MGRSPRQSPQRPDRMDALKLIVSLNFFCAMKRGSFEEVYFFLFVLKDGCSGGGSNWGSREGGGGSTTSPESPD